MNLRGMAALAVIFVVLGIFFVRNAGIRVNPSAAQAHAPTPVDQAPAPDRPDRHAVNALTFMGNGATASAKAVEAKKRHNLRLAHEYAMTAYSDALAGCEEAESSPSMNVNAGLADECAKTRADIDRLTETDRADIHLRVVRLKTAVLSR